MKDSAKDRTKDLVHYRMKDRRKQQLREWRIEQKSEG